MQYLGKQDLAKLLRVMYAANKTHHQAALIGFFAGARVSQILNVRGEDIFEREGKWVILIRAAKRGLVVTHSLHIDSDPAFDMTPLIELAKTKGTSRIFGGLSRQYLALCLKKYGAAAGIHSRYLHPHCLRHSAAHAIFESTQRIGAVSQFLAHRSASAAFIYLREAEGSFAQDAMDNLQLA